MTWWCRLGYHSERSREETQGRGPVVAGASAACAVLCPPVGREPLDAPPVWADPPAHRATHVASDLIERTAPGGSQTRSGAIPAGVSLRAVRGRISGEERTACQKGLLSSIPHGRHGRLESVRLAQRYRRQEKWLHIGNPGRRLRPGKCRRRRNLASCSGRRSP
jgi:hypothetical protein